MIPPPEGAAVATLTDTSNTSSTGSRRSRKRSSCSISSSTTPTLQEDVSTSAPGEAKVPGAAVSSNQSARVRSSRACTVCSQRKAKCDGLEPCSSCKQQKKECVYPIPKKRGPPKGAPARGGVKKKVPLPPKSESSPPLSDALPSSQKPKGVRKGRGIRDENEGTDGEGGESQLQTGFDRHFGDDQSGAIDHQHTRARQGRREDGVPHSSTVATLEGEGWARSGTEGAQGSGSDSDSDYSIGSSIRPQQRRRLDPSAEKKSLSLNYEPHSRSGIAPWGGDSVQHDARQGQGSEIKLGGSSSAALDHLPESLISRLLEIYQAFIHPHWPIIYLPSIPSLRVLEAREPILFYALIGVAAATLDVSHDDLPLMGASPTGYALLSEWYGVGGPQHESSTWSPGEISFHYIEKARTGLLSEGFEQRLPIIQASILISVWDLGAGRTSSSWHFAGVACRMALDMNLHKPKKSSLSGGGEDRFSIGNATNRTQEGRRTFWGCYVLDKILCAVLEKPVQLRFDEVDVPFPSVYERDEFDLWLNDTTYPFLQPRGRLDMEGAKVHALSSFQALCQVMHVLERILSEVYSIKARKERKETRGESDRAVLSRLDWALREWREKLPAHLQWKDAGQRPSLGRDDDDDDVEDGQIPRGTKAHRGAGPHVLTMRGWYCICIILLHRPRVPQLLKIKSSHQRHGLQLEAGQGTRERGSNPLGNGTKDGSKSGLSDRRRPASGLEACSASAAEVCDILSTYDSTFRMRKIPSSWVYLIFQSATIHAALAAIPVASLQSLEGQTISGRATGAGTGHRGKGGGSADEAGSSQSTSQELGALIEKSKRLLAQCTSFLTRLSKTWKSASHHVETLQGLGVASAISRTRPSSPLPTNAEPPAIAKVPYLGLMQPSGQKTMMAATTTSTATTIDPVFRPASWTTPMLEPYPPTTGSFAMSYGTPTAVMGLLKPPSTPSDLAASPRRRSSGGMSARMEAETSAAAFTLADLAAQADNNSNNSLPSTPSANGLTHHHYKPSPSEQALTGGVLGEGQGETGKVATTMKSSGSSSSNQQASSIVLSHVGSTLPPRSRQPTTWNQFVSNGQSYVHDLDRRHHHRAYPGGPSQSSFSSSSVSSPLSPSSTSPLSGNHHQGEQQQLHPHPQPHPPTERSLASESHPVGTQLGHHHHHHHHHLDEALCSKTSASAEDPLNTTTATRNMDWTSFWNDMPLTSEDADSWQTFMSAFC
ncbi:hypothetical protein IE53DRAFT_211192 [Violaceomyces palustris]|uniref:Uncharacterized protein n=1 Tax=Violaceomyces palustris TaxID=1673888 RepID=A0ACD0P533_9BASI|nr:hypothetical protein IE53DRAFT_211192 [Violaceomyces palustris]